jgi:hypothetical protein
VGNFHTPGRISSLGRSPRYNQTRDWMGLRVVLDAFDEKRQDGEDSATHTLLHFPQWRCTYVTRNLQEEGNQFRSYAASQPRRMESAPNYLISYLDGRIWPSSICEQMTPLILVPRCVKK